ncbi:MAG: hypothetical protein JNJ80_15230 [Gemmatimonadetes bacterium]|nr:hypothetical protein [Gemmatimonadota bacterium]
MRIDGLGSFPDLGGPRGPASRPEPRPAASPDIQATLSTDELNYFAELERMGPLTYGRRGARADATSAPAVLGQRIDVRA